MVTGTRTGRKAPNTQRSIRGRHQHGVLAIDAMIAMSLVLLAVIPIGYSFGKEYRLMRRHYQRAIAISIVDGEFEKLQAGAWSHVQPGTNTWPTRAESSVNLPPGELRVIRAGGRIRLEWVPVGESSGGGVVRDMSVPMPAKREQPVP